MCVYVCFYVCICVFLCVYMCVYVCFCVCFFVCTVVLACIYIGCKYCVTHTSTAYIHLTYTCSTMLTIIYVTPFEVVAKIPSRESLKSSLSASSSTPLSCLSLSCFQVRCEDYGFLRCKRRLCCCAKSKNIHVMHITYIYIHTNYIHTV